MNDRRRGLGRGLGSLIPTAPPAHGGLGEDDWPARLEAHQRTGVADRAMPGPGHDPAPPAVAGAWFAEVPLGAITPNPRQPRQVFEEEALAELVTSLKEVGLLQPVVVRQLQADGGVGETDPGEGGATDGPRFELIMGERRWRAAQLAGFESIPAIVRATEDDRLLLDALLENLHRAALNPLEEAAAYDQLLQDFACTHEALATRIGRSRSQVTNTLRLLKLPPAVQRKVAAGVLSAGHARALLGIASPEDQEHMAGRIVAEGLSVRAVEELVALRETARPAERRPRAARRPGPDLDDLATALADRWETRVKVQLGQRRGRIVVEFASVEDLERIVGLMAPGARGPEPADG